MMGIVLKFYKRKNYGFIKSDNLTFYFNLIDCKNFEGYEAGDSVDFETKGERAVNVSRITK